MTQSKELPDKNRLSRSSSGHHTRRGFLERTLTVGALKVGRWSAVPFMFSGSPALAQRGRADPDEPSSAERAAMSDIAKDYMQKNKVPGLSVAIGHAGSIVYKDVWGWADQESHEALTPQHLFRIASVSKPITSVTIFSLIEDDRLDLHDRVFGPRSILGKEFASPPPKPGSPSVDQITIEHLLTHTAGGWSNDSRDPMFMHPEMNHAQLIEWTLKERQLDHPPGQVFAYSNFGYCLLGRVIEKVTRRPYADYVRRPILSRCGIADMAIAGNTLADRRKGEVRHYGPGAYNMNVSRMDSHGGWLARPTDAVHFAMHVSGFVPPEQILRDETIRTMTTPTAASAKDNYAKGWAVNKAGNWWHTGILDGTNAVMVRTHSGFCWAAFINIGADIDDLDGLVWKMVGAVKAWKHA